MTRAKINTKKDRLDWLCCSLWLTEQGIDIEWSEVMMCFHNFREVQTGIDSSFTLHEKWARPHTVKQFMCYTCEIRNERSIQDKTFVCPSYRYCTNVNRSENFSGQSALFQIHNNMVVYSCRVHVNNDKYEFIPAAAGPIRKPTPWELTSKP